MICTSCAPDLVSNIIHGGVIASAGLLVSVLFYIRGAELRDDLCKGLLTSLFLFAMFVSAEVVRWALKVLS